jgi:hypothetical protein
MLGYAQDKIKYCFFGIDNNYPFELLTVAIKTVRDNTKLIPICMHTGLDFNKLHYLDKHNVQHHKLLPDIQIAHSQYYGALLRLYIPLLASTLNINGIVIYTDCDVMFIEQPPLILVKHVGGVGRNPWMPMSTTNVVNSGVLYLNVDALKKSQQEFIQYAVDHPEAHNAAAESIYNHFYNVETIPHTLNYFAYWDANNSAKILHFHGPKPCHDFIHPEYPSAYYNDHHHVHKRRWRDIRAITPSHT